MTRVRLWLAGLIVLAAATFIPATAADPPEIRIEFDAPTVEATDSGGADASYHVRSFDPATGDPSAATCDVPSGTGGSGDFDVTFHSPLGTTTVTCTATISGFQQSASVVVQDTTAPSFSSLPDVTRAADDANGAVVSYTTPTASDAVSGTIAGNCAPASGSHFDVGTTPVVCSATDAAGNTGQGGFDVIVTSDQPPDQPPSLNLPTVPDVHTTDPAGTQVTYPVSANDNEDGPLTPSCTPASGSLFPVGSTTVSCAVTDSGGHTVTGSFGVTVILDTPPPPADTTPPALSNVPANIQVEANGPAGSVVNFSTPTATDDVDGPIALVTCTPPSGSTFPLGTTTVTCSATDSHGNTGTATFTVAVVDTTPPYLIPPSDRSVYATTPAGIYQADEDAAAFVTGVFVSDIADPHPVVTSNAPSFFFVGVTIVTFTARDASGNTVSADARLEVLPMPAPGTTPAPLPPPTDRVPPDDVTDLVATPGDRLVTLKWTAPKASDFDHVVVTRSTTAVGAEATTIYTGKGNSFADTGVQNGIEYRYIVAAVDKAGNRSGGLVVVAIPKASQLLSPKAGARVKKTVKFRWRAVTDAKYYNLQIFRSGSRVLASAADVKVLSVWPVRPTYVLKQKWKYLRKRYGLTPGTYTWYVWPGFGPRSAAEYGELIGSSTFTVVR